MRATRGNKEYTIDESQKKAYQDAGFDILDSEGKVIGYGRGKTVSYDDYMQLLKENEALHKQIAELEDAQMDMAPPEKGPAEKKPAAKKAGE